MSAIRALLVVCVLSCYPIGAHAQSCFDTVVYFGNGVNTTELDAQRAARIMGGFLVHELPNSEICRYRFKVAYNQSENLLVDMLQFARETLGNEYPTLLMAFILEKAGLPSSVFASLLPAGALQEFNERFRSATVQHMISGSASAATVNSHVSLYQNDLIGKRVILVAHSQGNIYSNLASARLQSENPERYTRFAIIPVASPEYYTAKSLVGHVRFADDLVIAAVQTARSLLGLPPPLASNDQDNADVEFLSHYFLEAYLADSSSRRFILDGIMSTSAQLPLPPSSRIYRLTITGTINLTSTGFPAPFNRAVGDAITVTFDMDESTQSFIVANAVHITNIWRDSISRLGFRTSSGSISRTAPFSSNLVGSGHAIAPPFGPANYYAVQVVSTTGLPPPHTHAIVELNLVGPRSGTVSSLNTMNPLPLSKWSGANGYENRLVIGLCALPATYCTGGIVASVSSLTYEAVN